MVTVESRMFCFKNEEVLSDDNIKTIVEALTSEQVEAVMFQYFNEDKEIQLVISEKPILI
jgi:hypothetical protein